MKVAATGGGAVAAASLNKISAVSKLSVPIRGIIKIALGSFGPQIMGKGKKSQMIEDAGAGAISVGALELYNATIGKSKPLVISGINDTLGEYPARVYVDESYNNVSGMGDNTLGAVPESSTPDYSY